MENSIVKHNAYVLWNYGRSRLDVDDHGKLSVINNWNICGRIRKFFKNWKGAVTEKIHNAVIQTLDSIETARIKEVWDEDPPKNAWWSVKPSIPYTLRELADDIDRMAKFKLIPGIKKKTDYLRILSDRYHNDNIIAQELKNQRAKANGEDISCHDKFFNNLIFIGLKGTKDPIGCSDWD